MTVYDAAWDIGMKIIRAARRLGTPGLGRLLERVGTRIIPAPRSDSEASVVDGIRLVVPAGLPSARTYARGEYEVPVTQLVRRLTRPGMTLVDVGAFCGYYALLFSYLTGEGGAVYAFEPHPETFQYLIRNIRRNDRVNVTAVNIAITGTSGWGCLALHRWSDHHWVASGVGEPSGIRVQTVAMDDFFRSRGWPRVDLIKLDVEGAEHTVLQGMREVSRRNPQLQMIMELDHSNLRRAGTTWADTAATLQELGFRTGRVIEQDLRSFSLAGPSPTSTTCNILVTRD